MYPLLRRAASEQKFLFVITQFIAKDTMKVSLSQKG